MKMVTLKSQQVKIILLHTFLTCGLERDVTLIPSTLRRLKKLVKTEDIIKVRGSSLK